MGTLNRIALVFVGALFFVWPIPHTGSLRDLLLVVSFVLFGYLAWRQKLSRGALRELFLPAMVLLAFTVWAYVVAIFVSPETAWSLDEIHSQWMRALVALATGILVALAMNRNPILIPWALVVVFVALMVHIVYVDLEAVKYWLERPGGKFRFGGLTSGPDKINYLSNMLFCFLLAELYYRATCQKRMLLFPSSVLAVIFLLAVVSEFGELTRNGIVTLALVLLVLGSLYLFGRSSGVKISKAFVGVITMFLVVLVGAGLVASAKLSSTPRNLMDTVTLAWDTERNMFWQDTGKYDVPRLPNGEFVDVSTYLRVAWFKEGLKLVHEHPLGIGYGRSAFGHAIEAKYGRNIGHSHSGLLDIAIGIGIPGAVLWIVFFATLMSLAWRRLRAAPNYAAVLLLLVLVDYGVRGLLDSVLRDHMLQQFMFLAGLLAVMTVTATDTVDPDKPA
ncbi:MAG: O-antigen ligase family protein [Sulfuricaulis sp.]|nr:O-antigen ligase family protein [Sulfuricaulis sp.]